MPAETSRAWLIAAAWLVVGALLGEGWATALMLVLPVAILGVNRKIPLISRLHSWLTSHV